MGGTQKADLARRLGTRPESLRRSAGNWQLYAAVTGSAMAMATGATAAVIAGEADARGADSGILDARANPANSQNLAILRAAGLATARTRVNTGQTAQPAGPPTIAPNGIVPLYGSNNTIQPGEWVSIYGSNLAATAENWSGDFPQTLAGTSVTIDNKPAYLMFVSPTQINLQAPDDTATGSVSVVVTTPTGSVTSGVTLSPYAPSFSVAETSGGVQFVTGIILRSNGSGAYAGGTYDILGPRGTSLGYPTVPAIAGDTVELFAVGLGPTTPHVLAGQPFSGAAPVNTNAPITLYINNVVVKASWVGISSAGLYQINLTVPPGLGEGEVPILLMAGGLQTQAGVWFTLEDFSFGGGGSVGGTSPIIYGGGGPGFGFSSGPGMSGGFGGGSFGGGSGGGSGGSLRRHKKPQWHPKLNFPPQSH